MAYIGAEPQIGNYQICDAISVVNGQAAYTMQVSSTNVIPESANHMIVSLNGVIQKPGSSFTVSSSTITFASNLATGDSIDFIILLGNVLDLGVPSDSTVTTAKLGADAVTGAKIADDAIDSEHYTDGSIDTAHIADLQVTTAKIAADAITAAKLADDAISDEHLDPTAITGQTAETSAADDDLILLSDTSASAALKKMTRSNFLSGVGGNMSPSFHADLSSSATISDGTATDIVFNSENFDNGGCYDNSNGIFTVPSGEGGKYFLGFNVYYEDNNGNVSDMIVYFHTTISSSAAQDAVARAESTSNGTTFTELNLNYNTILTLSAGDQVKVQAYGDTNNSSSMSVKGGGNKTIFYGYKIIE